MANYMRRFIPGYSTLAQPLSSKVNTPPAKWPLAEMKAAFEVMQEAVQGQLGLAHLDYTKAIVVSADASVLGVGGVRGQPVARRGGRGGQSCGSLRLACFYSGRIPLDYARAGGFRTDLGGHALSGNPVRSAVYS